jgi:A/G-specific adenine glycosylase
MPALGIHSRDTMRVMAATAVPAEAVSVRDEPAPGFELASTVLAWYPGAARDLPWRAADAGPWAVLVSEVMLQQTPVSRVLPAYEAWLRRWPTPALLAGEPAGEAVRMWGRLGYPRRALRLHAAARAVVAEHGGAIPHELGALLALPGVGEYTARAVAAFAFRQRHAVVDTNVRRVTARALEGLPGAASVTRRDLATVEDLLPADPETAARAGVALMELGALVCTARSPRCGACPLSGRCAWRLAGHPGGTEPVRRPQAFAGTDRQVRGRLLAVLREADGPVPAAALAAVWDGPVQRERALAGLLEDRLAVEVGDGTYALPD